MTNQSHRNHQVFLLALSSSLLLLQSCVWCTVSTGAEENAAQANDWSPNEDSWHYWWSYSGVSGPAYWGLLNLDWLICDKGRRQSPINIETSALVYDPHLDSLQCDSNLINGVLYNDGHAIVFNASLPLWLATNKRGLDGISNIANKTVASDRKRRRREIGNEMLVEPDRQLNLAATSAKNSADVLRELSNSVEMSINQNDASADKSSSSSSFGNSEELDDQQAFNQQQHEHDDTTNRVQFSGAGLTYAYRFEALYLRFGLDSKSGSEHLINSKSYAGELQLVAYNSVLYKSYAEAASKPHGLLAIAIMIDVLQPQPVPTSQKQPATHTPATSKLNEPLENLLGRWSELKHRGSSAAVSGLNLSALLPETEYFITYDGSLTTPGCQETVGWLVLNKPLYITSASLDNLRSISANEQSNVPAGTLIAGNLRPIQPVNNRHIRTNVRPNSNKENPETCARLWTKYEYKQAKSVPT